MRKMTGWLLLCLCALQGCTSFAVVDSHASVRRPVPMQASTLIRTLGTDHQYSEVPAASVAERLRALHPEESLNILALSSGANSAFGAGALAGLTESGTRPDFAVVTGVSGGALVAPFAFLGSRWDTRLRDAFTSGAGEELLQSRGLGVLLGSSVYRGAPLRRLVDAHVTDAMIRAVAREAQKGRLLLVATTDVATGEGVVWDMGAIARNGGADARALFRDVLVASASVPGMFPPVLIRVREDARLHDEVHIDGAATMPFFVPTAFLQSPRDTSGSASPTAVYLIIDGPLAGRARNTRLTAREIFLRSVGTELNHMMLTTLELTAANAQLQGATLLYSAIPDTYPGVEGFDFRTDARRGLFRYAYGCAQTGQLWSQFRRAEEDSESALNNTDAQKVSCPATDVSNIGYFVSR
jgi:predicted acylesterase/phospholipase RssA